MPKQPISQRALEHAALVQIRSCYGCEDVTAVVIDYIDDPRFDTNWAILSLSRPSNADIRLATKQHSSRAIDGTHQRLRRIYSLHQADGDTR